MKLFVSIFLLFIISINLCYCQDKKIEGIEVPDSVEVYGHIEKSTDNATVHYFVLKNETATGITVTSCFGAFDIYISINELIIDPKKSNYYGQWNPSVKALGTNIKAFPPGTIIYVAIKGIEDYKFKNNPLSTEYSILISSDEERIVTPYYPVPAREGAVDVKLTNGGKSGTISFYKTGNPNDIYTIYTYDGERPEGIFPFSACGVKYFASENKQRIENNGDNEASATFTGLNPRVQTSLAIVVQRKAKGFSSVYNLVVFNSPNSSALNSLSMISMLSILPIILSIIYFIFI
ncbi:hypothetical protein DICPUDRAFT_147463 [Dictyostelium purpureum]|uniref:Uncharacterized protein n=1 Tax=Dictyostelium purpureum TaxID=5786 RepID=F0Z8J4_DICPU|nr:uncharacterized protein DICPUDRAFT_147463 [Dictyostelium purpureum]EGC39770.1 hypothetical protein DICPUDRAFT_147463 [Dictyostelium purpureum]|eukprot:XP_003283756.1 hypothetical protein DICPUDRAFT_147463 [Dictyostelium purpureum]